MDTFNVRGARSLARPHSSRCSSMAMRRPLTEGFRVHAEAPDLPWANATADAEADERLLHGTSWANDTDPWAAVYGHAGWWLSWRCPRREKNGTLPRITRLCYAREVRLLEKLHPPPPPQESPEEEARRRVVEILSTSSVQVDPWPEKILNPVMESTRYRTYRVPPFQPAARHAPI
ncbi:hypothetical protein SETIT_5G352300v2 [Setaria italica]|uniref:Uncharacterized protein n=1 Tax=Setaria italica TaxID=4555 RepID=A0A368RCH6_SETIT|nr:hypothetical protein SETIT_5G352300v2 [Setaria italica]